MAISSQTISVVVAVVAFFQLSMSGALDKMTDGFFHFDIADQIGVLAVVFAVIFAAVSMSVAASPVSSPPTTTSSSTKNSSNTNVKKD
mmetsp:Transcript_22258/g.26810  ORF Transcript_22258/g.26810 Transcript_22258/m.26810 type:complete len:88 (+) Transcript_22258:182-445(+)|eukprot:CAMPEP_0195296810 /NCGR_PEP_ID=MMETSP0707-20130614/20214_1 /TAXON_ID=33640 /ORGANISM="Asterionellopsis glacialis, Strain CCMP134" /LENGTH=87 /DNA_ID=CAMNT_0040358427 /DNA_START=100 /DNA_END=363 /DNA_ORIENTATION=-